MVVVKRNSGKNKQFGFAPLRSPVRTDVVHFGRDPFR